MVNSETFSPDGTKVVTASDDGTARVWETTRGESLVTLIGHEDVVNSAAFSPDGTRVVTASDDGTARVWDAVAGELLTILAEHDSWVLSAGFSSDGARIGTATYDAVSYTHLTLPTSDLVEISVVAVSFKKKQTTSSDVPQVDI